MTTLWTFITCWAVNELESAKAALVMSHMLTGTPKVLYLSIPSLSLPACNKFKQVVYEIWGLDHWFLWHPDMGHYKSSVQLNICGFTLCMQPQVKDWLWDLANVKGDNRGVACYVESTTTMHSFKLHALAFLSPGFCSFLFLSNCDKIIAAYPFSNTKCSYNTN